MHMLLGASRGFAAPSRQLGAAQAVAPGGEIPAARLRQMSGSTHPGATGTSSCGEATPAPAWPGPLQDHDCSVGRPGEANGGAQCPKARVELGLLMSIPVIMGD